MAPATSQKSHLYQASDKLILISTDGVYPGKLSTRVRELTGFLQMTDASPGKLLPWDGRVSVPAHRAKGQQESAWGRVHFLGFCLTLGCLFLLCFQMICSSGSNGSRFISCKAPHRGWFI